MHAQQAHAHCDTSDTCITCMHNRHMQTVTPEMNRHQGEAAGALSAFGLFGPLLSARSMSNLVLKRPPLPNFLVPPLAPDLLKNFFVLPPCIIQCVSTHGSVFILSWGCIAEALPALSLTGRLSCAIGQFVCPWAICLSLGTTYALGLKGYRDPMPPAFVCCENMTSGFQHCHCHACQYVATMLSTLSSTVS